uniref:Complex 1 LYR protein domain-containing protein n=1 Tax=Moniliophthora roreri TaxID=221103 RepID=A0A0W0FC54_MONRR
MNALPIPSSESLAFRANLTNLISPLRRVRPTVPFWRLAAHKLPTVHLYRHLLKAAPTENIRFRIRKLFRKHQHLTSTTQTKQALETGYKWLNIFQQARAGDAKWQAVLQRYDRCIESKIEQEHLSKMLDDELAWQHHLKNRPILTGSLIPATQYNRPMLRMRPQHPSISSIIIKRMKTKERRFMKVNEIAEYKALVFEEKAFEKGLLGLKAKVWNGEAARDWRNNTTETNKYTRPYPEELIEKAREARRKKIAHKTDERERERRGEVLKSTRKRMRKGLPAHLLSTLSKEDIKEELIIRRSRSEVGYVGHLKQRRGWKLKIPKGQADGKTWSVIDGEWVGNEDVHRLKDKYKETMKVNKSRRQALEPAEDLEKS